MMKLIPLALAATALANCVTVNKQRFLNEIARNRGDAYADPTVFKTCISHEGDGYLIPYAPDCHQKTYDLGYALNFANEEVAGSTIPVREKGIQAKWGWKDLLDEDDCLESTWDNSIALVPDGENEDGRTLLFVSESGGGGAVVAAADSMTMTVTVTEPGATVTTTVIQTTSDAGAAEPTTAAADPVESSSISTPMDAIESSGQALDPVETSVSSAPSETPEAVASDPAAETSVASETPAPAETSAALSSLSPESTTLNPFLTTSLAFDFGNGTHSTTARSSSSSTEDDLTDYSSSSESSSLTGIATDDDDVQSNLAHGANFGTLNSALAGAVLLGSLIAMT